MTDNDDGALRFALTFTSVVVVIGLLLVFATVAAPIVAVAVGGYYWHRWYRERQREGVLAIAFAEEERRADAVELPSPEDFAKGVVRDYQGRHDYLPTVEVLAAFVELISDLYARDFTRPVDPGIADDTSIEAARYRDAIRAYNARAADPSTLLLFRSTMTRSLELFVESLPPMAKVTPDEFVAFDLDADPTTVPLADVVPDLNDAVQSVFVPFYTADVREAGLFKSLRTQLDINWDALGSDADPETHPEPLRFIEETPLIQPFLAPVPFAFDDRTRFEHWHLVGGTGHGKTQTLQHFILRDLECDDPPALVIIDRQNDMLAKIQRFHRFASDLRDRIVIVDPEDEPPALNMFAFRDRRLQSYSRSVREQIEANTIALFAYVFSALDATLTSKQETLFNFATRLMFAIPDATIYTLRDLMEENAREVSESKFARYIGELDPTAQAFFRNQFFSRSFADTRTQVVRRLYDVLRSRTFDAMFSARDNKLDLFDAFQNRKVVLVNTARSLLQDAHPLFGRTIIAQCLAAAFERVAVAPGERPPAYVIIDEAADYFDDNIEELLSQARKYNVGVLIAHQNLAQMSSNLLSSVLSNTTIKMAGGVSNADARKLAPDMKTKPEFIEGMTKSGTGTAFAVHVKNRTATALRLEVPFLSLERAPSMSDDDHAALLRRNRERLRDTAPPPRTEPQAPAPQPARPHPDW